MAGKKDSTTMTPTAAASGASSSTTTAAEQHAARRQRAENALEAGHRLESFGVAVLALGIVFGALIIIGGVAVGAGSTIALGFGVLVAGLIVRIPIAASAASTIVDATMLDLALDELEARKATPGPPAA